MQLWLVFAVIASHLSPEGQHLGDDKHCWYITRYMCMIKASQVQHGAQGVTVMPHALEPLSSTRETNARPW